MGNLRLDPNNPSDRKILEKAVNKDTGQSALQQYLSDNKKQAAKQLDELKKVATPKSEKPKSKNKYGARGFYDHENTYWASQFEYNCYVQLLELERIKIVKDIETQVTYKFEHNDVYITRIKPDFRFKFYNHKTKKWYLIIADAKSEYIAKQLKFVMQTKLLKSFYDIDIMLFIKDHKLDVYSALLMFTKDL